VRISELAKYGALIAVITGELMLAGADLGFGAGDGAQAKGNSAG